MPEIHVLPRHLVNKIAAGEVIERPASVVKELVENALDAGSTRIDLTIEEGGAKLIAVSDDGKGMSPDDLALAFVPHATSKLAGEDDLYAIRTMGFRGEALASIASVSHAHILTRRKDAPDGAGCEIRADGESVSEVRPAAAAAGTTITVRDLFFNTPARRKFMRAPATELGYITDQLARCSLPNPHVAFTLTNNGRTTHRLQATQDLAVRVRELFGEELAEGMIAFDSHERGLRLYGLAGKPSTGRASANWQYFFVNGRYVRDRFLGHALREAYRGLIEPSRYPVAMIFLEMPPEDVDVNVHPAKIEVRFRNGQQVHSQVLSVIRETLNRANLSPAVKLAAPSGDVPPAAPAEPAEGSAEDQRRQSLKQALADFFKSAPRPQPRLDYPSAQTWADRPPAGTYEGRAEQTAPPISITDSLHVAQPPSAVQLPGEFMPRGPYESPPADPAAQGHAPPAAAVATVATVPDRPHLQIHNSYIVVPTENGLAIIDQHALHERILYEELSRRLSAGNLAAQRLLIPETVEVSPSEKALLLEQAGLLEKLGLELTEFGPTRLAVQKFPLLLAQRGVEIRGFLRDLMDLLGQGPKSGGEEMVSAVLETMACKAAVKAGDPLTQEEIRSLLARREQIDRGSSCPHGRPTTLSLSLTELEKQFKRT